MIPLLVLAGITSGVSAISGLFGASQARKQQEQATAKVEEYLSAIRNLSQEQLQQVMQAKQDWENTFGGIRENLANYYQNLNPNTEAARRIQALEQNYNNASERINTELASRGLASSGIAAQANTALLSELASRRADAQYSAQGDVAKAQSQFYQGVAMPESRQLDFRESQALQTLAKANYAGADYYQQVANTAQGNANNAMQQVGQALGGIINTIATGVQANELGLLGQSTQPPSTALGYSNLPPSSNSYFSAPLTQQTNRSGGIFQQDSFLKKFTN